MTPFPRSRAQCGSRRPGAIVLLAALVVLAGIARGGIAHGTGPPAPLELSFYYDLDLRRDDQVRSLEAIWRRAAAAGYRKVVLCDPHFARLDAMDDHFRANAAHVRELAAQLGLEIVPLVFQVGRSNEMLGRDPNLAEGVPVKGATFVVHAGEARLVADPPVALPAALEGADPGVRPANGIVTTSAAAGRGRFHFTVRVSPYRCYHVSVRVRSRSFEGQARLYALGDVQPLDFGDPLRIEPTRDWTTFDLVFNSLDHDRVTVWMGLWKGTAGELDWSDWRIEEVGLLNVLRRPGAPCVIEGYVEGRDYQSIRDPALEAVRGVGDYSVWHEPPAIRTGLPEGTRLRVSWYQPFFTYNGVASCCPSDSGTIALLGDEAARMRAMWGARGYLLGHDEIRCIGWDAACAAAGRSAGAVLAANVRRCVGLLQGAQAYVWNDMFDPLQNAHADYYMARGDLAGSWEGLDPGVVVINWNSRHRTESLQFFAQRGHRQIVAAYYDAPLTEVERWLAAARGVAGVTGVMYTTWRHRYDDLERFAEMVKSETR